MNLEEKLAAQAVAKAYHPTLEAANDHAERYCFGPVSDSELDIFCKAIECLREYDRLTFCSNVSRGTISFKRGSKFAKIIVNDPHTSVYCFVDLSNGNILKAAGWNAPAKGVRGNIRNGAKGMTPYGAPYNR